MKTHRPQKLLLLWGAVLLFSLGAAGGWAWFHQRIYDDEYARAVQDARLTNDGHIEHTLQVVDRVDTILRAVRAYYVRTGSLAETERFMGALSIDKAIFDNAYLVDARGTVVITHDENARGRNTADRDYFRYHQGNPGDALYIASVESGRVNGRFNFRLTRRINNTDGSFAGVVLVAVNPQAFSDYYRRLNTGADGTATLLGTLDRKIRARNPEPAPDAWQVPVQSPLWEALQRASAGAFVAPSSVDGRERQYIYEKVGELPLVMLTGFSDTDVRKDVAAQMRPITIAVLSAIVFITMLATILTMNYRQREQLHLLATTDALTGIANRRHLMEIGLREVVRTRRYGSPLSVLMLDIDRFKRINDTWGHPAGDRVIQTVAQMMTSIIRDQDTAGRLGGEEFMLILPETDQSGAHVIAERLRLAIEESRAAVADDGSALSFTASLGVATLARDEDNFEAMLGRADRALYRAKNNGRNRVAAG